MNNPKRFRIALYTPFLSGYYGSDLVFFIRRLSITHNFDLILIQTKNFNTHCIPLALNRIDGVIVLANCIGAPLVHKLLDLKKPVVSVSYSYYPLETETVFIDNASGVCMALQHLIENGHTKIGFVGDTSVTDVRLRLVAYKAFFAEHAMECEETRIFIVHDTFFSGGIDAADRFIDCTCDCTAMFFATDFNALGFQERLQSRGLRIPEDIALVGFDNVYLGRIKVPSLTTLDQNFSLMAEHAVLRILDRLAGGIASCEPVILPCRLIVRGSTIKQGQELSIAPSLETRFFSEEMFEGMLSNNYEVIKSVSLHSIDELIHFAPLFGSLQKWGSYCTSNGSTENEALVISKSFSQDVGNSNFPRIGDSIRREDFPPESIFDGNSPKNHLVTLLPLVAEGETGGLICVSGDAEPGRQFSTFSMFANYLDLLSFEIERANLMQIVVDREKESRKLAVELDIVSKNAADGIWIWDLQADCFEWNSRAVQMLGYIDEAEIRAKKNMPLYELVHPEDVGKLKEKIQAHLNHGVLLRLEFRILNKDKEYIWIFISGEVVVDGDNTPVRIIGSVSDVSERHRSQEKIKYMAYYDNLTGLPNRAMTINHLHTLILGNEPGILAVMLLDLDRFKYINDSYGHDAGDRLLKYITKQITSILRTHDFFARFGGDEFILVCPVEEIEEAETIGTRILNTLTNPYKDKLGFEFYTTGSLGLTFYPHHGNDPEKLIKNADIAMYTAKKKGKNQLAVFQENLDENVANKINIENLLRKSVNTPELQVYIQPKYQADTLELVGGEILLRWFSKEVGLVSPGIFIPIAEEIHLIIAIGKRLLAESCTLIKAWERNTGRSVKLSINISAEHILKGNLLKDIRSALSEYRVNPACLCIEMTESIAITDITYTKKVLMDLKREGIQLSLDDFGTGYSSLSLLKELPLDELKIDKSFMPEGSASSNALAVLKAIIEMGHSLGFKIVAEGVETGEQLELLQGIGCDIIQGFYLGKPQPVEQFDELVRNCRRISGGKAMPDDS